MKKRLKPVLARHLSRWRSSRHWEAHLRFPGMDFHEALTRVTYRRIFGVWPDLDEPKTISEKMCWLKVNDRRPVNAVVADKWRMRDYAERLGLGHMLTEVIAAWDSVDEIDFASLPDAYALKVSNGSSWNVIKRPGIPLDIAEARRRLRRWTETNWADHKGEWYYALSPAKIIAEAYLDSGGGDLPDYKLFVFNGETRFVQYCEGRFAEFGSAFLSPAWEPMPFTYARFAPFEAPRERPPELDEMLEAARKLSRGFPLIRADFYLHRGRVLLGELSLNPVGGYTVFTPDDWNRRIGDWLTLPDAAELNRAPAGAEADAQSAG